MRIGEQELRRVGLVTAGLAAAMTGSIALGAPAFAAGPASGATQVSKPSSAAANLGLTSVNGAAHATTALS